MAKLSALVGLATCLLIVVGPLSQMADADDQELDSERELQRMLTFIRPLMGILRSDQRLKRSTDMFSLDWVSRGISKKGRDGYGYGGGDYGHESCCNEGHDYLGLISLISLGLLFLFLITLLSTTSATGRKKRSENDNLLTAEELLSLQDIGIFTIYFIII